MDKADALDTTIEDYRKIIECKTASLFIAAVKSGAISAGAEMEKVEAVAQYAYHLGMAFQMRDDIFDYSPKMDTGKLAGADLKERKITLPLLCAMESAPHKETEIRSLVHKIESNIASNDEISSAEKDIIMEVTAFVNGQNGIEKAQAVLEEHIAKAIESISMLPESTAKERLVQLAEYVGKRNN